jgi:twitching motility protein PilT
MTLNYTMPQLLKALIDQGASDLHITPNSPPRLRVDGSLIPLQLPPLSAQDSRALCYSILTEEQKRGFESMKEIDLSFGIKGLARFRANIFMQNDYNGGGLGVAGAFRVIPYKIRSTKELGLPPVVEQLAALPRGLVLVTGPTGSGKSTTLAAMIDHVNETRYEHVVTIEDPIEYLHPHKNCIINQREVGRDTDSYAKAMRSILREDPDVCLIGEMRDLETTSAAITTAETGHLVFGTLHTNSCVTSLNRIIDIFPEERQIQVRTQLAFTLQGVLSQMLLPSIGGGRVMALEIMIPNIAIRNLIRENKLHQVYSTMQAGQSETYMQTMNQSLVNLLERRLIELSVAMEVSHDPEELTNLIQRSPTLSRNMPTTKHGPKR